MRAFQPILLLTLLLVVSLPSAGCGGGNGTPGTSPTAPGGYTIKEIDFPDDFSNPDSGWGGRGTPDGAGTPYVTQTAANYLAGEYSMQLGTTTQTCWMASFTRKVQNQYQERKLLNQYRLGIDVTNDIDTKALGGIYFNDYAQLNKVHHNVFVICPKNRTFAVAREGQSGLDGWERLKVIYQSEPVDYINSNGTNRLEVEVISTKAKLFINGKQVYEMDVPSHEEGEIVGLYLSNYYADYGYVRMRYDNFYVNGTEIIQN